MKKNTTEITVFKNVKVRVLRVEDQDYFCITDLAKYKNADRPDAPISSWINAKPNLDAIHEWELLYNSDFKPTSKGGFNGYEKYLVEAFMKDKGNPTKWATYTNGKAFLVQRGRYGGTYAHATIALHFANYVNTRFYINLLEEYQVLKKEQTLALGDPHNIKRHLTSGNYSLLVASIFSQMDERLLTHPQPYKSRLPIAREADMLNQIVFGCSAKDWRSQNADKPLDRNMRDYASMLELVILNNLEFLDSMLLQWDCELEERQSILQEAYDFQYPILKRSKTVQRLEELSKRLEKGD